ncbi:hypothetical protein [Caulobacter sp.]|uniref:hypothetical protein n=1 Tax=Caulobacter sp. TaxID=78 RepID=UPI003BB1A979
MGETITIHKETAFGRVLLIQERAAVCKAWLARLAREQAAEAIRETQAKPLRYLAPR